MKQVIELIKKSEDLIHLSDLRLSLVEDKMVCENRLEIEATLNSIRNLVNNIECRITEAKRKHEESN